MIYVSVLVQHHAGPTGNVLIGKNKNGFWEFPNGKARTNESDEEAVSRICWETLGMKVSVGKCTLTGRKYTEDGFVEHFACGNFSHNTHSKYNHHNYYEAIDTWQVEPSGNVYSEFKWVHPSKLSEYEFEGDDVNFMAKYSPWINGREIPDVRMY